VGARRGKEVVNRYYWGPKSVREEEERSSIELIGALSGYGKREKGRQ
jgi:hypothetical protein